MDLVFFDRFKNLTTRSHYMPRKKRTIHESFMLKSSWETFQNEKKVNILVVHALPDLEKHRHLKQETPENIQSVHAQDDNHT